MASFLVQQIQLLSDRQIEIDLQGKDASLIETISIYVDYAGCSEILDARSRKPGKIQIKNGHTIPMDRDIRLKYVRVVFTDASDLEEVQLGIAGTLGSLSVPNSWQRLI